MKTVIANIISPQALPGFTAFLQTSLEAYEGSKTEIAIMTTAQSVDVLQTLPAIQYQTASYDDPRTITAPSMYQFVGECTIDNITVHIYCLNP
jgi:hypothetical protein